MAALISIFNTGFLSDVLTTMTREVLPPVVQHVGSVDSWPADLVRPTNATMIFNTDYTYEAGEHWVAVYIDGQRKTAYLFDSLPDRPFPQNVLHKLGRMGVTVIDTNPHRHQLQLRAFPLCGLYCLAFLERISKQEPFHLSLNDQLSNDLSVLSLVLPFIVVTFEK